MTTGISYVHGARDVPLLGETLGQNLDAPPPACPAARR